MATPLDKSAKISLVTAASIILFAITTTWNVSRNVEAAQNETKALKDRMTKLESEAYTIPMACEVALRTVIANPGMSLPDPRDPKQMIEAPRAHGTPRTPTGSGTPP